MQRVKRTVVRGTQETKKRTKQIADLVVVWFLGLPWVQEEDGGVHAPTRAELKQWLKQQLRGPVVHG